MTQRAKALSLLIGALATAAVAAPQRKAVPKRITAAKMEPAACAALHDDYEMASKKLALSFNRNALNPSAAGSGMQQTDDAATMEQAHTTLDLMRGSGCRMPTAAPSKDAYLLHSLDCLTARMRSSSMLAAPECDMKSWKPEKP